MSYIERDGILKDLQEELELDLIYYNDDVNKGITEGLNMAIKHIKRFPTADVVEVRHGYWKWEKKIEPQAQNRLYCSICDNECLSKGNYYVYSTYCPNCGAKMDGERREE